MRWYSASDMPGQMLPAEDPRDLDALLVNFLQLFLLVHTSQELKISAVVLVDACVPHRKNYHLKCKEFFFVK